MTEAGVPQGTVRRAIAAAGIGNFVEHFDLALYGYLAIVLSDQFFPGTDSRAKLLNTFAIFGGAFLIRPIGALFFGRLGDKIGRRPTLVATVLTMSLSTALVGALPTYQHIGVLAPLLLFVLRMLQGFSVGGEFTGASALVFEYSPPHRRGLAAGVLTISTWLGLSGGAGVSAVLSTLLDHQAMAQWGWRVPFLLALPLAGIGLYLRMRVGETPAFQRLQQEHAVERAPLAEVLRTQRRRVGILLAAAMINATSYYVLATYWPSFLSQEAGLDPGIALWASVAAYSFFICMAPVFGILSDRVGRRPMWLFATAGAVVISVPAFWLSAGGSLAAAAFGQILYLAVTGWMSVGITVLNAELFPARVRYSASSIGYNLGYAVFGGTAPYIATFLIAQTGSRQAPPIYIMCIALVAFLILVRTLPELAPGKTASPSETPTSRVGRAPLARGLDTHDN